MSTPRAFPQTKSGRKSCRFFCIERRGTGENFGISATCGTPHLFPLHCGLRPQPAYAGRLRAGFPLRSNVVGTCGSPTNAPSLALVPCSHFTLPGRGTKTKASPLNFRGSPENRPPQARQRTGPRRGQAEPGRNSAHMDFLNASALCTRSGSDNKNGGKLRRFFVFWRN